MKYVTQDNIRGLSAELATALKDPNAAIFCQRLDYLLQKEPDLIIDGVKYIRNTYEEWRNKQFQWLSVSKLRKCIDRLRAVGIVKVIRYRASQWNQTNYYTLDYKRMDEFIEEFFQNSEQAQYFKQRPVYQNTGTRNLDLETENNQSQDSELKNK